MSQPFDMISDFFNRYRNDVVKIEILPNSFEEVLAEQGGFFEEEKSLMVLKRTLVQAFLTAREIFTSHTDANKDDSAQVQKLLTATQTILLFAPEHLTAANFRKLYLISMRNHPSLFSLVDQELSFTAGILTSPLHRQSKSPTIWSHRFWTLSEHYKWRKKSMPEHADVLKFWNGQLTDVVFISGQQHPNNYYAWSYARSLLRLLMEDYEPGQNEDLSIQKRELIASAVDLTSSWCLRQPSDTSGWSFLFHLFSHAHGSIAQSVSITTKVLDLTFSFKWDNEAIWVFLRTVVASLPKRTQASFVERLETYLDGATKIVSRSENETIQEEENRGGHLHLEQNLQTAVSIALKWIVKNS